MMFVILCHSEFMPHLLTFNSIHVTWYNFEDFVDYRALSNMLPSTVLITIPVLEGIIITVSDIKKLRFSYQDS